MVMKLPSPPPPTKEAKTAVPMALTVAMRMPGEDDGGGQGELHMEQAVHPGHAHAPARPR